MELFEKIKRHRTALYVVGALAGIGFFSTVFFKPVIFVLGIYFSFVLVGLALPIGITYMLYVRETLNSWA